jgi:hypothetical protein
MQNTDESRFLKRSCKGETGAREILGWKNDNLNTVISSQLDFHKNPDMCMGKKGWAERVVPLGLTQLMIIQLSLSTIFTKIKEKNTNLWVNIFLFKCVECVCHSLYFDTTHLQFIKNYYHITSYHLWLAAKCDKHNRTRARPTNQLIQFWAWRENFDDDKNTDKLYSPQIDCEV